MQQNPSDSSELLQFLQQIYNNTNQSPLNSTFNTIGAGIGGLTDLAGLYFGAKQLKQAENQFRTNTEFANRNLANQSKLINNQLEARYRAALAAKGIDPATGGTSPTGSQQRESLDSYLARSRVDGSAVGG